MKFIFISNLTLRLCLILVKKASLFLLFNLFLLLFMSPIALFSSIHESYFIISVSF